METHSSENPRMTEACLARNVHDSSLGASGVQSLRPMNLPIASGVIEVDILTLGDVADEVVAEKLNLPDNPFRAIDLEATIQGRVVRRIIAEIVALGSARRRS